MSLKSQIDNIIENFPGQNVKQTAPNKFVGTYTMLWEAGFHPRPLAAAIKHYIKHQRLKVTFHKILNDGTLSKPTPGHSITSLMLLTITNNSRFQIKFNIADNTDTAERLNILKTISQLSMFLNQTDDTNYNQYFEEK